MSLVKHLPALQILLPFFGALIAAITFRASMAWFIAALVIGVNLIISTLGAYLTTDSAISYYFGDWAPPIGIEYRLDFLNQPAIVYVNSVLLFLLIFGKELVSKLILDRLDTNRKHLFYSLLLFAHTGYLGILSTNDLFNLYVFIEISSLAAYSLMSLGNDSRAVIGAFDYLIMGTIGATLILIAIGFLFALTGSLNITDIVQIITKKPELINSRILPAAVSFFIIGAILKMAFFPLHFWMIRAYSSASPIILTYLASISGIMGVYMIVRFWYFTVDVELITAKLSFICRLIAIATIIIGSYLALIADDLKKIAAYSTAAQTGYIFLLLAINPAMELLPAFLVLDGLNKVGIFTLLAHVQTQTTDMRLSTLGKVKSTLAFKLFASLLLIFSAGLPITSTFILKIKIIELLLEQKLITIFVIMVISSVFAVLYNLKFARALFFSSAKKGLIVIKTKSFGLFMIVIIQFMTLILLQSNNFQPENNVMNVACHNSGSS